MTAGSGVVRGLLLGSNLNDTQEPPAWRAQVGEASQAQGTRTDSLAEECCRHVAEKARMPGRLPSGIGQGESGRRGGRRGGRGAGGPHLCQLQLCNHTQLSELLFPHLQNALYPAGCHED